MTIDDSYEYELVFLDSERLPRGTASCALGVRGGNQANKQVGRSTKPDSQSQIAD